jgi:hypothetical protein
MNSELMLTLLREILVKKIFSPEEKSWSGWLAMYKKSLSPLLGVEGYDECKVINYTFDFCSPPHSMGFNVTIRQIDQFDATIIVGETRMWQHHVDRNYRTMHLDKLINEKELDKKFNAVISKTTLYDVRKILDDLLFHPEVHQHIDEPPLLHDFRIGGGISNTFQFLIHLRCQMFPKEERTAERDRLGDIIFAHIKSTGTKRISSTDLFMN